MPAVILSVVWTFNMFNIIYLVSQGEPAGATEILITDAYKIAFEQYRYGYAAAYSVVIFMIVILGGSGNMAGVLLGAFLIIGLPELFREFASARMLVFGIAMMVMMVVRTQGLLPPRPRRFNLDRAGPEAQA